MKINLIMAVAVCMVLLSGMTQHVLSEPSQQQQPSLTQSVEIDAKYKPHHSWRSRASIVLANDLPLDQYARNDLGGWLDYRLADEGVFRVQRDDKGRWWLVDSQGCAFLTIGMNAVRPNNTARSHDRMRDVFGSKTKWAQQTQAVLQANSFNTLGAWSYWRSLNGNPNPMPYTLQMNFAANFAKQHQLATQGKGHRDYLHDLIPVFHPGFEQACHDMAASLGKHRGSKMLLGVFSDNEMPFPADALDRCLGLAADDPSHIAAQAWLKKHHHPAAAHPAQITDAMREQFLKFMVERYFRICHDAIATQLPDALYLGSRFHGKALRQQVAFEAAGAYVDVLSINWYGRWTPQRSLMDNWLAWSGRPFFISEFYAKGMDTGMPNRSGAGWCVRSQADRGLFYQHFTLGLLQHPGCVGWHWFRYMDNDPEDVLIDPTNIDSNKGVVDSQFKPYPPLLKLMHTLNARAYALRDELCETPDVSATDGRKKQ